MEALQAGRPTLNELGFPGVHDLSRGFIPPRIGAIKTAPQRMEALRAGRPTLNESGLPGVHGLSRGFIPPRIGAVETQPQRMEVLWAGHLTPTSRVYPTSMP
jgi:predicted deacetylase